jgi:hypothetical protein
METTDKDFKRPSVACCRTTSEEMRARQVAQVSEWKVQGSLLKSRLLYVQMKHGVATLKRILAGLPEDERRTLTSRIYVGEWYSLATLTRLDDVIFREIGAGNPNVAEDLGSFSAELNLNGMYEPLLQKDVEGFLRLSAVVSPTFQSFGSARYDEGPKAGAMREATVSLAYATPPPSHYCQSGVGYFKRAVELCGGAGVSVDVVGCCQEGASECRFRIRWQAGGASSTP